MVSNLDHFRWKALIKDRCPTHDKKSLQQTANLQGILAGSQLLGEMIIFEIS